MKLWDKIWTAIFLIVLIVFSATMAYEFFFIKATYLKTEEVRMDQVAKHYETNLKDYLSRKSELAKNEYMSNGRPQISRLKDQDTFVFIEGKNGIWNNIKDEDITFKKLDRGYFISSGKIIYGYTQEVDGSLYIFKLNKSELKQDQKWKYYDVIVESYVGEGLLDSEMKLEYDYFEKKYFFPVKGGSLVIDIKRQGILYNTVMDKGRKVFIVSLAILAFIILLVASYLEKRIAKIIKNAAIKMNSILLDDEASGEINLGRIPEFKVLERGLNNIIKKFNDKKRKYRLLYDDLPLFAAILDLDLNIIEENNYFKRNLKKNREEKTTFLDYIPKDKINLFTAIYRKIEKTGEAINENFYLIDNNLNTRIVVLTMKKANIEDGKEVILFTGIDTEALDIKQLENRSAEKYDILTNVYTEKYGHYYLDKYINMCKISNFNFLSVVVWINFKKFEEELSDETRIKCLKMIASSIKKCLRGTDLVYKFDRNSFALLLSMMRENEADIILRRIEDEIKKNGRFLEIKEKIDLRHSVTEYDGMSSKNVFIKEQIKSIDQIKEGQDRSSN